MPEQSRRKLTKLQKRLLAEVTEIAELARVDHQNILDYDEEERTTRLKLMKNQIVRSQVIADYTFIDEMLGAAICHYFFWQETRIHKAREDQKVQEFQPLHFGSAEHYGKA